MASMSPTALVKKVARQFGYEITRAGVAHDLARWAKDEEFNTAYEASRSYSLLGVDRRFTLWQDARAARVLGGGAAQVGVYKGGSAKLIGLALKGSGVELHLFDTFEGMPAVDASIDLHKKGDFSDTSLEAVQQVTQGGTPVHLYKGIFPQTAGPVEGKRFSFVYIDTDIYTSTRDSLAFFYPRLVPGAAMVFDDYQGKHTPGVKKALDEFLTDKPERPILTAIGQCLLIKHA